MLLHSLRLALFSIAYGLMGALVGGTLNRLLVAELGLPVSLVGFFLAIPLLTAPLRIWLGHRSDTHTLFGRRREPYIWAGAFLAAMGLIGIAFATASSRSPGSAIVVALLLCFIIYGFGRNLAHNIFQALLAERFTGHQRRFITLYEAATLVGSVIGAGTVGQILEIYDPARLRGIALVIAIVAISFAVLATIRQESATMSAKAEQAQDKRLGTAVRELLIADPQVRRFFLLVLFTVIGTLTQDVLLEPYAALVLHMQVGATTRLTAFWGIGVLLAMLLSGTILIKWLGYQWVLRLGLVISMCMFVGLALLGTTGSIALLQPIILSMGFGTGLAGAGMLTGIISFTSPLRAGLMMGVWGMANLLGRAIGVLAGGIVVDIIQAFSNGNALLAYTSVFAGEAMLLIMALFLSFMIRIDQARASTEQAAPALVSS